jgi:uncharacterized protein (TIGR02145 family)
LDFLFSSSNVPTYNKDYSELLSAGWITQEGVLFSKYDAAHVQWGGEWRMPTKQEFEDLNSKCDWSWGTMDGMCGYVVRGRGDYKTNSIFLPCAGYGRRRNFDYGNIVGNYWSASNGQNDGNACYLYFGSSHHSIQNTGTCYYGYSIRPVQSPTK